MRDDYYELLGLNNGATSKEVTKAFRKASLRLHPDKVINSSDAHKNWARDAFDAVKEAYEILSDPKARRKYDVRASWMASHSDQILPAELAPNDPATAWPFAGGPGGLSSLVGSQASNRCSAEPSRAATTGQPRRRPNHRSSSQSAASLQPRARTAAYGNRSLGGLPSASIPTTWFVGGRGCPQPLHCFGFGVHPATPATPLGGQASPQRKRVAFKNSCAFPADAEFSLRSPATPSMSLRPFSNTG
ncbi:unnamed protein product [Polarella glacialis]|uniref:J domain-containing protein n=1 Tax=Polarella glacialis TaxID=89957 RepID=A0A813FMX6_POLGL|nr:unnamed protein product [Polarella glacialis]|mmetsp:Transcript_15496/g.27500  ORF Transcript_15496/g.27500 Transcript_15496/m.27500 type:complete len:246 (+) Transcript_15496:103-840(+)